MSDGRKYRSNLKEHKISVKLSTVELEKLDDSAANAGVNRSKYIRELIRGNGNTDFTFPEDRANLIAGKDRIGLVLVDIEHTILVVGTKEVGHQFHHLTYLFLQGEFLQSLFYLSLNLRVALDNRNIGTGCISQCQH